MEACEICREPVEPGTSRKVTDDGRTVMVHENCFLNFAILVKDVVRGNRLQTPTSGVERLARIVNGALVLMHRSFPNDQMPLLVYLAHLDRAVPVNEVYGWLRQNQLNIKNPSLSVLRLREKGLVATFAQEDTRYVMITEEGKRTVHDYASSLE